MGVVDLGKIRGTMWYTGKAITGTSSAPVIFENSGISYAYADDLYANTENGNLYVCIAPGAEDTATWSYIGCIEGPQPPLINNLNTNSTTMALTAKMGKTLDEKINNAGLYPFEIIPMLTEASYLLRMEIEDKDTTITIYGEDDEEGTYTVTPLGISDRQTVSIPLNTAIGFSQYGAVIRDVKSSGAAIFSYILFDENTQEQCNINLKLWDSLLDQIDNIKRKGVIVDGTTNYLTAEVSQVLDGERKSLFPITHDKAVWHDKTAGQTLHEKIVNLVGTLNTLDTSLTTLTGTVSGHTSKIATIEETLDGVPEQIAEVQNGVNLLNAKILDDLDDVLAVTDEGYITGALATKQLNSNLTENYIGFPDFSNQIYSADSGWSTTGVSYTATENCWVYYNLGTMGAEGNILTINGKNVALSSCSGPSAGTIYGGTGGIVPLKKGNIIKSRSGYSTLRAIITVYKSL